MAAVLGLGIIIGCICGLVVPSAAADDVFIITSAEKIGEIELGEYPQTYVGNSRNKSYKNTTLTATGKKYTTYIGNDKVELIEYLLADGRRVAELPSAKWTHGWSTNTKTITFADNTPIEDGATYFFDVEPIKFDLFATNGKVVAVAQNALGSMAFGTTNEWSQSAIRTFFHNNFATEAKLTSCAQAINHYNTVDLDDHAGLPVSDTFWLPSANEMRTFYTGVEINGVKDWNRVGTDLVRATYTDDRGPYGSTHSGFETVCYLRGSSKVGELSVCGIAAGIVHGVFGSNHVFVAYFPAFVLNDATAQYKTNTITATCQTTGYTESWWEINGQKFNYQKYDEAPMIDHVWGEWSTVTASTCVNAGLQKHTCTVCGTTETIEIAPDNAQHAYNETVVAATCTTAGYTEHTCTNDGCTLSYRDNVQPALGHAWGEWVTTKEPTATTPGTAERHCTRCDANEQKTLPATAPVTGTTSKGGDNSSTVWLIFGIIAGGVLVLGGGAVSWLFIAGRQKKEKTAAV